MATKQLNVRLPEVVIDDLNKLAEIYGSQAKALMVAITNQKKEIDMSNKTYTQKPFRRSEVDPNNHKGWVVDLSSGYTVNPDCYWYFGTRKQANYFLDLLNEGKRAEEASHIANAA